MTAEVAGRTYRLVPHRYRTRHHRYAFPTALEEAYDLDARYWVDGLPTDRRLVLTGGWAQVGLPETRTTLALDGGSTPPTVTPTTA